MDKLKDFIKNVNSNWEILKVELEKTILENFNRGINTKKIIFYPETKIETLANTFGIYFFEIKPKESFNLIEFQKNWKINTDDCPKYCPNLIKGTRDNIKIGEWNPFYIGKSEKLSDRINQHRYETNRISKTSGLKLNHRKKLIESADFRISFFEFQNLQKSDKHIIQFVITNLEKSLRTKLKPWVGKQ